MTAARTATAGLWDAGVPIVPQPPRVKWEADLLHLPAGSGKTLVAGGIIRAGIFEWCIPTLPPVR